MTKKVPTLPESPSVLIILMGALGDVARGMCLLEPLRNRYPTSKITWLIEPKWKSFIELHSLVDEVLVFDRPRGMAAVLGLRQELRKRSFDVTLDLQRHLKSGLFSYLSGAPIRVGFAAKNAKEGNWLFQTHHIPPYEEGTSKVQHYLSFCDLLDAPSSHPLSFGLSVNELVGLSFELLPETHSKMYFGLVLGSSWESKDWTPSGYLSLCHRLNKYQGGEILLFGDSSQQELASWLGERARVTSFIGKTTVPQLASLIARCQVVIGPDSGPGHIASAVGTPMVPLFGPTDERRVAPYGTDSLVVRTRVACAPCLKRKCPGLDKICMRLISVEDIIEKIDLALQGETRLAR
ncbi:MAG: glycosyltransferase family 9 protein [Bdellovibrionales bacterium]|nr:glycosyltransferase family 9 protein [Bdellovibrionales bacterium]